METLQIIRNYNSFEIPKTRKEIAEYLITVIKSEKSLDDQDRKLLDDFNVEFEYDISGTLENSTGLIGGSHYNPFSQKQKYLYLYDDPGKINLFINLTGEGNFLNKNGINTVFIIIRVKWFCNMNSGFICHYEKIQLK